MTNAALASIEASRNAGILATSVSMEGANALVSSTTSSSTGSATSAGSCVSTSSNALNYRPTANAVPLATFADSTQQQQQDMNGNMAATALLHSKTLKQHLPNSQNLATFNMKKVLQAQSCCSLQRAEVENMWNAAAAALANRSNYNNGNNGSSSSNNNANAGTVAATSSPTLIMPNGRKLSNVACHSATPATSRKSKNISPTLTLSGNSTATALALQSSGAAETFGSRYLKQQQSYYKKGCPLCGKFRYDQDNISSTLSISIESDLEQSGNSEQQKEDNAAENAAVQLDNASSELQHMDDEEENDDEDVDYEEETCSCVKAKQQQQTQRKQASKHRNSKKTYQKLDNGEQETNNNNEENHINTSVQHNSRVTAESNSEENQDHVNNNNNDSNEQPTTSAAANERNNGNPSTTLSSASSTNESCLANVNLDCINENGLISLDMSKIIDKTGLPTYDAAIKLESSGYV